MTKMPCSIAVLTRAGKSTAEINIITHVTLEDKTLTKTEIYTIIKKVEGQQKSSDQQHLIAKK
jgi:hypothetical protein